VLAVATTFAKHRMHSVWLHASVTGSSSTS
jgi:hypothetical protein